LVTTLPCNNRERRLAYAVFLENAFIFIIRFIKGKISIIKIIKGTVGRCERHNIKAVNAIELKTVFINKLSVL
jgi:hypothetical protein